MIRGKKAPHVHKLKETNSLLQLYYHYNIVLQLKALYDEILRPELAEDNQPPPSAESQSSKKEKGKQAAGGGGGKKEKEKGGKAVKEEVSETVEGIDVQPEQALSHTHAECAVKEPPQPVEKSTVPDWDLSTDSLLQVSSHNNYVSVIHFSLSVRTIKFPGSFIICTHMHHAYTHACPRARMHAHTHTPCTYTCMLTSTHAYTRFQGYSDTLRKQSLLLGGVGYRRR